MGYWKYNDRYARVVSLVGSLTTENLDFSLSYVNYGDEEITGAYLFIEPEYVGLVYAKLANEDTFREVSVANDATAYLGVLAVGETEIDFRFTGADASEYYRIPVWLGANGDYPSEFCGWAQDIDHDSPWVDCFDEQVIWRDDSTCLVSTCPIVVLIGSSFESDWHPQFLGDFWNNSWRNDW